MYVRVESGSGNSVIYYDKNGNKMIRTGAPALGEIIIPVIFAKVVLPTVGVLLVMLEDLRYFPIMKRDVEQ